MGVNVAVARIDCRRLRCRQESKRRYLDVFIGADIYLNTLLPRLTVDVDAVEVAEAASPDEESAM